jgi:hypothetical protein
MATRGRGSTLDAMGPEDRAEFFRRALTALSDAGVRYMIGGAYALERFTGVTRDTKDIDVFVMPRDCGRTLGVLANQGFGIELSDPNWLAKAFDGDYFLDIIFNSGNGICPVDEGWFAHAVEDKVLGLPVSLCPLEEMLWQKCFIMERERYDGADIAHILRSHGPKLDWARLLDRVGDRWEVLLSHLIMVNFVYPDEGEIVPQAVMEDLLQRYRNLQRRPRKRSARTCQGTLISRYQYLPDVLAWGYRDPRPKGVRRDAIDAKPEVH